MMISPNSYMEEQKDKSYKELIKERDKLIRYIRKYEKNEMAGDRTDEGWNWNPSPDVVYQCYLDYLSELCHYMTQRYNRDYEGTDRTLADDM